METISRRCVVNDMTTPASAISRSERDPIKKGERFSSLLPSFCHLGPRPRPRESIEKYFSIPPPWRCKGLIPQEMQFCLSCALSTGGKTGAPRSFVRSASSCLPKRVLLQAPPPPPPRKPARGKSSILSRPLSPHWVGFKTERGKRSTNFGRGSSVCVSGHSLSFSLASG